MRVSGQTPFADVTIAVNCIFDSSDTQILGHLPFGIQNNHEGTRASRWNIECCFRARFVENPGLIVVANRMRFLGLPYGASHAHEERQLGFGSSFSCSALAHFRVPGAAACLGVTIGIVGWPMSLASVIFSPLSAVASNEGIGLFGAPHPLTNAL
jgi:hypothetical protein